MPVSIISRTASATLKAHLGNKTRAARERRGEAVAVDRVSFGGGRNNLQPELKLESWPVNSLKLMTHRVRKSDAAHVTRVIAAIKQFGNCAPVLITADGVLIDGVVRLEAAKQLGLAELQCLVVDHLNEHEIRQLRVSINRVAELGEWDLDALKIELQELISIDVPVLDLGFTAQEIDIIVADGAANDDERADKLPTAADGPPVTQPGDIWLLGKHRVICGNSLEAETHTRLMAGSRAAMSFLDMPYNVPIAGFVTSNKAHREFAMGVGEMSDAQFHDFMAAVLEATAANLEQGSLVFATMDWRQCHLLINAGKSIGLKHINTVVWDKGAGAMGSLYRSAHELMPVFCKGEKARTNNIELGKHGRDRTNVWHYPGANRKGSSANAMLDKHSTPKPTELVADAMLDCTKRGDIVVDACLGSGTTIIAAEMTGRIGYGIEIDCAYVDVIVRRWEEYSGKEAVHEETGLSFSATAEARAAAVSKEG